MLHQHDRNEDVVGYYQTNQSNAIVQGWSNQLEALFIFYHFKKEQIKRIVYHTAELHNATLRDRVKQCI
jgi:hypothetical protein